MALEIVSDSWGKRGVRLVRRTRRTEQQDVYDLLDLAVDTTLRGDTDEVYHDGNNAKILSTDAQKNTVYAFAKRLSGQPVEVLATRLARQFVDSQESVSSAEVDIRQASWDRVRNNGAPAPHSFLGGSTLRQRARAIIDGNGARLWSGFDGLKLFNTTGSEFRGFPRDPYTTGDDVADRALATDVSAEWRYSVSPADGEIDFEQLRASAISLITESFATIFSKSIQYSMERMATAVLSAYPSIEQISLSLPNLHHAPADLTPFGLENEGEILIPLEGPHSLIEATFRR